jgi:hypothetical protein
MEHTHDARLHPFDTFTAVADNDSTAVVVLISGADPAGCTAKQEASVQRFRVSRKRKPFPATHPTQFGWSFRVNGKTR